VTGSGRHDVEELLPLALSRPHEALARAQAVLAGQPGPYEASIAHQAAGIVLRDVGDAQAGVRELRAALRLARQTGSAQRQADTQAALGVALVHAGRTADGLAALDRAAALSTGVMTGQVLQRRGMALWTLGRYRPALDDLRRAVGILRAAGDPVWTARALTARGLVYVAVGSPARADDDFVAAGQLYAGTGQQLESVHTVLNRALAAFSLGDLPAALSFLDTAADRYRPLHVPTSALSLDRCAVLLAAGLASDALAEADAGLADLEQIRGRSTWKSELLLMAASCALAAAQPQTALDRAQAAHRLFRSQQSAWWQAHTGLVLGRARYAAGPVSLPMLRAADRTAQQLAALRSAEATQAHLLAGRVALDLGRQADAERHLSAAARSRRHGPALARASGWLGEALRAEAAADPRRMLAACRRGLAVLDEFRLTLGASELRARATAHGTELAVLAQRHAARSGRPRLLLSWSERWRATALAVPAVRPPAEAQQDASLAALREISIRLENTRRQGKPATLLQREQLRLERAVRASSLRARGQPGTGRSELRVGDLLDQLGAAQLIEIVDVDGAVHVLVCGGGQVRQYTAGRASQAARGADLARFALRRLARSRPGSDLESALAILKSAGPQLQDALLGPAAGQLGDGPVVIVPPGKLHSVPWALLPALADRVFSVAPSATAWMRADTAAPPPHRRVTLARGPGLATDGAEVPLVAPFYQRVTLLAGADATAGRVLHALDGAWLGHIAAHGSFRADSPLFSALHLHDGPLTVYDLAPAGANELLGLVSSLLPLGTAGIIASVVPLNDEAAVPLMVDLHRQLHGGQTLAGALRTVRQSHGADPIEHSTALSLTALGAG